MEEIVELWMSTKNPEILSQILLNGKICTDSRLAPNIIGKNLPQIVNPFSNRYIFWNGLIEELIGVLNTRNFTIKIVGTPEVYDKFVDLLSALDTSNVNLIVDFAERENAAFKINQDWINQIANLVKDSYLRRQLKSVALDKINLKIIHSEKGASGTLQSMAYDFLRLPNMDALKINLPAILISANGFFGNLENIFQFNQVDKAEVIVIFVGRNFQRVANVIENFRAAGLQIFSLTGNLETDKPEIERLRAHYFDFLQRRLLEFIYSIPADSWKSPETVKRMLQGGA